MKSSLGGSWYLSPRRHVVELIGFSVLFTTTFLWTYGLALQPGGRIDAALQEGLLSARHHSTDKLWAGLLAGSLCVVSIHKYLRGGGLFLLQPCHVSATALIWVLLADPKAALPHVAFNILISAQWGGWMAVLFPDLRDYKLPCEIENFWLEHGLVCGLPLLLIATGRFIVFPLDVMFTTAAFLFNGAFHSVVLHAVALLSGFNINYQINPPPVRVVERLGKNYKAIMYLFTWLVTLATRYIAVEALLQLTKGLR
ncbi:TMEM164 family-domain-containing protein [Hyaloraphidium curvatum]|nr:TMEM164 family-domain-containing protein [Hyaloraphidium curvatum]